MLMDSGGSQGGNCSKKKQTIGRCGDPKFDTVTGQWLVRDTFDISRKAISILYDFPDIRNLCVIYWRNII